MAVCIYGGLLYTDAELGFFRVRNFFEKFVELFCRSTNSYGSNKQATKHFIRHIFGKFLGSVAKNGYLKKYNEFGRRSNNLKQRERPPPSLNPPLVVHPPSEQTMGSSKLQIEKKIKHQKKLNNIAQ